MVILEDAKLLLRVIHLLPLEKCTDQDTARSIYDAIDELLTRDHGLSMDDPLRFHVSGRRLSKRELAINLERVINSWRQ